MQPARADARRRRWYRSGQIILLGAVLAGLQLLLLAQAEALAQWAASPLLPIGIGALLYLLIPALAAFLVARRQRDGSSALSTGCLVGVVSAFIIAILAAVSIVVSLNTPPSPSLSYRLPVTPSFIIGTTTAFVLIEWFGALLGGLLGGAIGNLLGHRQKHL